MVENDLVGGHVLTTDDCFFGSSKKDRQVILDRLNALIDGAVIRSINVVRDFARNHNPVWLSSVAY